MACKYRYIHGLYKKDKDYKLWFGSLIHECLKVWHPENDISKIKPIIDKTCVVDQNRFDTDEEYTAALADAKKTRHYATAMMKAYAQRYPTEPFVVDANMLEKEFDADIARTNLKIKVKADGIVYIDDLGLAGHEYLAGAEEGYYLLEHKTTSSIGAGYFDKLWTDLQIVLYSHYIQKQFDIELKGVLYNVLQKPLIRQAQGETEEEFEERRQQLIAKSKTGKTSAKRKMPEPDEDFLVRLSAVCENPDMFQRKIHVIPEEKYELLLTELSFLTDDFKRCCETGVFYRNELSCFNFNTPCDYFPLCAATNSTRNEVVSVAYGVNGERKDRFKCLVK